MDVRPRAGDAQGSCRNTGPVGVCCYLGGGLAATGVLGLGRSRRVGRVRRAGALQGPPVGVVAEQLAQGHSGTLAQARAIPPSLASSSLRTWTRDSCSTRTTEASYLRSPKAGQGPLSCNGVPVQDREYLIYGWVPGAIAASCRRLAPDESPWPSPQPQTTRRSFLNTGPGERATVCSPKTRRVDVAGSPRLTQFYAPGAARARTAARVRAAPR